MGNLDFYESLDFAAKFHATVEQAHTELYDSLKPHGAQIMTHIDTELAIIMLEEFHK